MPPAERRRVLGRLGFRVLDVEYVQPALSKTQEKCRDLVLMVHESGLESARSTTMDGRIIVEFMHEFYNVIVGPVEGDEDYERLRAHVARHPRIAIVPTE